MIAHSQWCFVQNLWSPHRSTHILQWCYACAFALWHSFTVRCVVNGWRTVPWFQAASGQTRPPGVYTHRRWGGALEIVLLVERMFVRE